MATFKRGAYTKAKIQMLREEEHLIHLPTNLKACYLRGLDDLKVDIWVSCDGVNTILTNVLVGVVG